MFPSPADDLILLGDNDDDVQVKKSRSSTDSSTSLTSTSEVDQFGKLVACNLAVELKFPPDPRGLVGLVEGGNLGGWRLKWDEELMNKDRIHSEVFQVGGYNWRITLTPRGSDRTGRYSSLFLESLDAQKNDDEDWHVCVRFILSVRRDPDAPSTTTPPPSDPQYVMRSAQHRFDCDESDWGFNALVTPSQLAAWGNIIIEARIRIMDDPTGVLWHSFNRYDSRKHTGFAGLANQGATCYMNSLLQSLFMITPLVKACWQIPTEGEDPNDSVALALQRLFYRLHTSPHPVSTSELTRSFGWDAVDAFMQHDVQEFSRVLLDELEKRMKKTPVEGTVESLLTGKIRNIIQCTKVDFTSSRTETFYDVVMPVRGLNSLQESFAAYVKEEVLAGDNAYLAEGHGRQEARKYVRFDSFPPVLHLHLERYTFDPMTGNTVKINDRFEFPLELNLDAYLTEADPAHPADYVLHSVLVHSGDSHGGHYWVCIRDGIASAPEGMDNPLQSTHGGRWFKFDDSRVTPAWEREAVEDNFGGLPAAVETEESSMGSPQMMASPPNAPLTLTRSQSRAQRMRRITSAYMLVYIRKELAAKLLEPLQLADVPAVIADAVNRDDAEEERRRRERELLASTVPLRIISEQAVWQHHGPDLVAPALLGEGEESGEEETEEGADEPAPLWPFPEEGVFDVRLAKDMTVAALKEYLAKRMGVEEGERVALWLLCRRQNRTVRLDIHIDSGFDGYNLGQIAHRTVPIAPVKELGPGACYLLYACKEKAVVEGEVGNKSLIFFKLYDPVRQVLSPILHLYISPNDTLLQHASTILAAAGLPMDCPLDWWEEVKPSRVDRIHPARSLSFNQLGNGDIIIVQPKQEAEGMVTMDADQFVASLNSRFHLILKPMYEQQQVTVVANYSMEWTEFVGKVAMQVGVDDASRLRLYQKHSKLIPVGGIQPNFQGRRVEEVLSLLQPRGRTAGSGLAKRVCLWWEVLPVPFSRMSEEGWRDLTVWINWYAVDVERDVQELNVYVQDDSQIMEALPPTIRAKVGQVRVIPLDDGLILQPMTVEEEMDDKQCWARVRLVSGDFHGEFVGACDVLLPDPCTETMVKALIETKIRVDPTERSLGRLWLMGADEEAALLIGVGEEIKVSSELLFQLEVQDCKPSAAAVAASASVHRGGIRIKSNTPIAQ